MSKSHVFRVNLLWVALLKHSSSVLLFLALISCRVLIMDSEQPLSLCLSICYCLDLLLRERKLLAMSNLPRLRRQLLFPQNLCNNPSKDQSVLLWSYAPLSTNQWKRQIFFPPSHTVVGGWATWLIITWGSWKKQFWGSVKSQILTFWGWHL